MAPSGTKVIKCGLEYSHEGSLVSVASNSQHPCPGLGWWSHPSLQALYSLPAAPFPHFQNLTRVTYDLAGPPSSCASSHPWLWHVTCFGPPVPLGPHNASCQLSCMKGSWALLLPGLPWNHFLLPTSMRSHLSYTPLLKTDLGSFPENQFLMKFLQGSHSAPCSLLHCSAIAIPPPFISFLLSASLSVSCMVTSSAAAISM